MVIFHPGAPKSTLPAIDYKQSSTGRKRRPKMDRPSLRSQAQHRRFGGGSAAGITRSRAQLAGGDNGFTRLVRLRLNLFISSSHCEYAVATYK